jgi:hypothetical protein
MWRIMGLQESDRRYGAQPWSIGTRIVSVRRDLSLAIRDRGHIVVVVVAVGFGLEERIFARAHPIHIRIGIDRLLGLGIGHGEQIAVGVVGGSAIDLIQRETFVAP